MSGSPDNPAERVRQRMRDWMETVQIGQRAFAADLNKSQIWLQKILAGENSVRLKDLDDVARAMRTTASELIRSKDDRYQLELTPTEVRIVENLRRRPEVFLGITALLHMPPPPPPVAAQPDPRKNSVAAVKRKKGNAV